MREIRLLLGEKLSAKLADVGLMQLDDFKTYYKRIAVASSSVSPMG